MISRREVLGLSLGAAAFAWRPLRQLEIADPDAGVVPPGFPSDVRLYKQVYENWSLDVHVDDVWTADADSYGDLVRIANWAAARGWRIRPSGMKHNWAPYNVMPGQPATAKVVLVDMTRLNRVVVDRGARTVWAEAGALMDDIMIDLETHGLGFTSIPAPGAITIGGALAINGHGAAVPAAGENTAGRSYGSLSNRVRAIQVLAWDQSARSYKVTAFDRSHPTTKALLTSMGRVFVVAVLLQAERNYNLRCVSRTDIPKSELFAAPADARGKRTYASFVERTGRVETISFAFTDRPWLKTWQEAPTKPGESRGVRDSYNYPFSDNIPLPIARLAKKAVTSVPASGVQLGQVSLVAADTGLNATKARDLWGPARRTQHYIKASTMPATALSHAVLTSRSNIQRVVHEYTTMHETLTELYRAAGLYPANMPVEIRACGVEDPSFLNIPGAEPPSLSAMSPRPDRPDWDTVIFLSSLALVGSRGLTAWMRDFEQWMIGNFTGDYAMLRPEWSKAWACSADSYWTNAEVLHDVIPATFRVGRAADATWDWAIARFRELDPHNVFGNPFVDRLLR